jgi:hypothetical protein
MKVTIPPPAAAAAAAAGRCLRFRQFLNSCDPREVRNAQNDVDACRCGDGITVTHPTIAVDIAACLRLGVSSQSMHCKSHELRSAKW